VISAILLKRKTGVPWRDLPDRYPALAALLRPLRALAVRRDLGSAAGARPDRLDAVGELD
jgi:hypothetical protein